MIKVPFSIQALATISKIDPKQGDSGIIKCPKCRMETFNWWRSTIGGKISGACECGLRLPK